MGETYGGDLWGRPMGETYGETYGGDLWGRPMGETYGGDLWGRPPPTRFYRRDD